MQSCRPAKSKQPILHHLHMWSLPATAVALLQSLKIFLQESLDLHNRNVLTTWPLKQVVQHSCLAFFWICRHCFLGDAENFCQSRLFVYSRVFEPCGPHKTSCSCWIQRRWNSFSIRNGSDRFSISKRNLQCGDGASELMARRCCSWGIWYWNIPWKMQISATSWNCQ